MDSRRLAHWSKLAERRRRRARSGLGAMPPWLWSALAGVALFAALAHYLGAFDKAAVDPFAATNLWVAATVALHVVVVFGAPFRLYWRRDSGLLGRLALPGDSLFGLALRRTALATALAALPCAMALSAFGIWANWEVAARHAALLAVAVAWAALAGPALALLAGAIISSEKTAQLLDSVGGEFQAPKTTWLGMFPGLGATALALALIAAGNWPVGDVVTHVGNPLYLFAPAAAVPVALFLWTWRRAPAVMSAALLEVSALDRERLAHVDLTRPSLLERGFGRMVLSEQGCRVYEKDARLMRRRYPIPYFVGLVGMVAMWIVAAVNPASILTWAFVLAAGSSAYGVVMARRRYAPPIEHPQFLRTLAITPADVSRAKRAHTALWFAVYVVAGLVPVALRLV